MANLAVVGSSAVNGVAVLHSRLLAQTTLRDFAELWPKKFLNVTNGVSPRRFLRLANPRLSALITARLGDDRWLTDLDRLQPLEAFIRQRRAARNYVRRAGRSGDAGLLGKRSTASASCGTWCLCLVGQETQGFLGAPQNPHKSATRQLIPH